MTEQAFKKAQKIITQRATLAEEIENLRQAKVIRVFYDNNQGSIPNISTEFGDGKFNIVKKMMMSVLIDRDNKLKDQLAKL